MSTNAPTDREMINPCTFCRILRGELPKTLVDEGEHCIVILDRNQSARGHLLVIPKSHVALWHELDAVTVREMSALAHAWSKTLVEALHPDGYNLLLNAGAAAGQDVFHAHLHITPRTAGDGYYRFGGHIEVPSPEEAAAIGTLLRSAKP
jgi:histidine triad (HIT) family protein